MPNAAYRLQQTQLSPKKENFTSAEIEEIQKILRLMLHQAKKEDYIRVFSKNNGQEHIFNYMYQVKELLDKRKLRKILSEVDIADLYHSANTYKSYAGADEGNLSQILNIVIDIDYKKSFFYKHMCPETMLDLLEREVYGQVIPCPSITVYTGNNFHIVYYLKSSVNATEKAKVLTKRIQRHITKELQDMKADKSINLSTMTRFNHSVNSKTSGKVFYKLHNKKYFLSDLQEYLPELPEWYSDWKSNEKIKKAKVKPLFAHKSENDKIREVRKYSLIKARLSDLAVLQDIRNGECYGTREVMCFLYRNFAREIMTADEAEEAMYQFNSQFQRPLVEKRIESKTRHVNRRTYHYRNSTLIEVLDIQRDEERQLSTIISTAEKEARQKERNKLQDEQRKAERRNEQGLTKREQAKQDMIQSVKAMLEQGKGIRAISRDLGISPGTVSKIENGNY